MDVARRRYFSQVVVRRIKDAADPDLPSALELYEQRIPDAQRFEAAGIVRRLSEGRASDCFLIAKFRKKVCGFSLFHYYPERGLGLFAYMVVAKRPGIPSNAISQALMSRISYLVKKKKGYRDLEGFVMEVEDPRLHTGKKRLESLARVRRFSMLAAIGGFSVRAVDISYKQPPLGYLDADNHQEELLLLFATATDTSANLDKRKLAELLEFIYLNVYPDGYSADQEECIHYKEKCARLKDKLMQQLPERARMLSLRELAHYAQAFKKGTRS